MLKIVEKIIKNIVKIVDTKRVPMILYVGCHEEVTQTKHLKNWIGKIKQSTWPCRNYKQEKML